MLQPINVTDDGRLAGTRITVYDVIPYRLRGRCATYVAAALGLSTPEIEALYTYMDDHHAAVMAVHERIEARIARGNPPELVEKQRQSHEKFMARVAENRRRNGVTPDAPRAAS